MLLKVMQAQFRYLDPFFWNYLWRQRQWPPSLSYQQAIEYYRWFYLELDFLL